jgi:hypothetical protein
MPRTPWIGLAALVAMFLIPFLPAWLFEGPRRVRHWPQRHVCGECGTPWTNGHLCAPVATPEPVAVTAPAAVPEVTAPAVLGEMPAAEEPPLRGELRRLRPPKAELERAQGHRLAG